jgi:glycosyltransferase involved in cell wall biosynthesis
MMVVEPTTGGTARHVVELAVGCRRRGLEVHLVCATRRDADFRDALRELCNDGVTVDEIGMRREVRLRADGAAAIRLRALIRSARPDVLHLHSSKAGAVGRGAVFGLGRHRPAVVYTPHAYAFLAQEGMLNRWSYWCAERALLPWTDRVVAVSESEGRVARRLGAEAGVVIIPNGVDASRVALREPELHAVLRVGWLGRMTWQKNPEAAVKISLALTTLGVEHALLLGGDGPNREHVLDTIRALRVERSVRLLGWVHDTAEFHRNTDLQLMTSRSEGLPYAGLDAMAQGVPVAGFDVPGVQDLVRHGVTGLLAAPGNTDELAAHIARLASDPELRRRMGAAAQHRVREEFRLENQVDRLCRLYQSLAQVRPNPAPITSLTTWPTSSPTHL